MSGVGPSLPSHPAPKSRNVCYCLKATIRWWLSEPRHRYPLSRSHHLRQIRTPCRALVAHIASLLLGAVGSDLGEQINHRHISFDVALFFKLHRAVVTVANFFLHSN